MLVPQLVVLVVSAVSASTPGPAGPPFTPPEWVRADAGGIKTAPKKLEAACDAGESSACVDLAYLYATGTKVRADPSRARDLAREACVSDSARACALFGYLTHDEPSIFQDPYTSHVAYERACSGGHAPACFHAALASERGEGLPAKSPDKARAMLEQACEGGFQPACARKIRPAPEPEEGDDIAPARGPEDTEDDTACGDALDCVRLAYQYHREGPNQDGERAVQLFGLGCARGHPYGCATLAELHEGGELGLDRSDAKALELWERACDLGFRNACTRAAKRYFTSKVRGDHAIALDQATRACEASDLDGCFYAGRLLLVPDPFRGYALLSRTCDAGHAGACTWKAIAHKEGWGVPASLPRALEILGKLCDAGPEDEKGNACFFLGLFLKDSKDPKARARAPAAFEKACEAGHEGACEVGTEP